MKSYTKQVHTLTAERTALKKQLRDTTPDIDHPGNVVKRLAAINAEVQSLRTRAAGRVAVSSVLAPPARPAPATPATAQTEEQFMAAYNAEKDPQLRSRLWRQHEEAKRASKGAK